MNKLSSEIKDKPSGRIILVTGGQRSGKSEFAERLALQLSSRPVYLATAVVADEEMQTRVEAHKRRRESNWENIEAPLFVSDIDIKESDVVLLDCLTLLATNWFFKEKENSDNAFSSIREQLDSLFQKGSTIILVTNEIGMGGISANPLQRKFTDLQGKVNQFAGGRADEAYLLVSGIPVKIK